MSAVYTFGVHASQTYDAETLKSQFRRPSRAATTVAVLGAFVSSAPQFVDSGTSTFFRPASNPQGALIQIQETVAQDPTQIASVVFPSVRTPPVTSGKLGAFQYVAEQPQDRPAVQQFPIQRAGSRPGISAFQVSAPQIEDRPTAAIIPSVRTPIFSTVGVFQWTPEQFQERSTQQARAAQIAGFTPRTAVWQFSTPQYYDFTLPAVFTGPSIGRPLPMPFTVSEPQKIDLTLAAQITFPAITPPAIFGPTVRSYVSTPQPDLNINYSALWTPSTFSPGNPIPISQPAGRHRKWYGVRDGTQLLIFDSRVKADAARVAIAQRENPPAKPATRRIRVVPPPHEVVPLDQVREALPKQAPKLIAKDQYTPLARAWEAKKRQSDDEEELAMILLHIL